MQVKKKIFPYPIINHNLGLSNFGNKFFILAFEQEENENAFVMKNARFETDSKLINDLYNSGKVCVYCVIECSHTVYRKKFKLDHNGIDIVLSKVDFTEKVEVSMFAVALTNFVYNSEEFEEDYKGVSIEVEKNDIIGANDGFTLVFDHVEEEDSFAHSIFSIVSVHDMPAGAYTVECTTGRKIVISMSDEDYKNYKIIYTYQVYKEVFFNMILVPALIEGLSLCQMYLKEIEGRDLDDAGNQYLWFRSVVNAYKKLKGEELSVDEFKRTSMVYLAQELLGKPLSSSLEKLVKETNSGINAGGSEDE